MATPGTGPNSSLTAAATNGIALPKRKLASTRLSASSLGLGCSRIGSLLGSNRAESERLVSRALELGVNFFDTADIYGQGESERTLGRVLPRDDSVVVATKVGQRAGWTAQLASGCKGTLRPFLRRSQLASQQVRSRRELPLRRDFSENYIRRAVEASLRRLKRETLDVLLLHSPAVDVIMSGQAMDTLSKLKGEGRVHLIGVSVDSSEGMVAALQDGRVDVIQCRFEDDAEWRTNLRLANDQGVVIVAREIFGGVRGNNLDRVNIDYAECVRRAVADESVSVALIGTTKVEHLVSAVRAAATHSSE